ncbi:MAG: hypothetical protein M3389_06635 [Actinomycetota bacterium]|nr:hypothetical protein [Actinomycetota bacterium]
MASALDQQNVGADVAAFGDPHIVTMRPHLVAAAQSLIAARSPKDFYELQEMLLGMFAARQQVAAERRTRIKAERAHLSAMVRRRPKPSGELLAEQQRTIAILEHQDRRDQLLQHVVRVLADGMAWRLLNCDRRTITIYGNEQRVGRLAPEDGFRAERAEARQLWDEAGTLALHNDLTNCLRSGDLTVLCDWPPRSVIFREVKADGRDRKDSAQARRLEQKHRLSSTGLGEFDSGGPRVQVRRLSVAYRTYLYELPELLETANRVGYAQGFPSDYLGVAAIDYRRVNETAADPDDLAKRVARARGWIPESDRCFGTSASITRLRERHHAIAYFAPISIFPLGAEAVIDLLLGQTDYVAWLSVDALKPFFDARSITVEFASGRDVGHTFLTASRGGVDVTVPATLRNQMLRELMTAGTLVDIVDEMLLEAEAGLAFAPSSMSFPDESEAWPAAQVL